MAGLFDDTQGSQGSTGLFDDTQDDTPRGGFVPSAKKTIGQTVKGIGQAAADFIPGVSQDNAVKRYGQEVIDANPTAVNSFSDIPENPLKTITEATGNAAPSILGMVGAKALGSGITAAAPFTGPAAPVVAGIGQAVSWLGPTAVAALPSYGGIRDKQVESDTVEPDSFKNKAVAALGAATVGFIEQKFGPQDWAMRLSTKAGRDSVAKMLATKTLGGSVAKGIGIGGAVEGGEELVQSPVEQLASFENPLTRESLTDTAFGGVMGAVGGGAISTVHSFLSHSHAGEALPGLSATYASGYAAIRAAAAQIGCHRRVAADLAAQRQGFHPSR